MKGNIRMMKCSDELSRNKKTSEKIEEMQKIQIYMYIYIFKKYKMLRVSAETFAKNSIMFATSQIKKKNCG